MNGLRDLVDASLRARDLIDHYNLDDLGDGKANGNEYRAKFCPVCGRHERDHTTYNLTTGQWKHHGAECKGDKFDLVAGFERLDARDRSDWPKVLEAAARIAGISVHDTIDHDEVARRRAARDAEDLGRRADEAERRRLAQLEACERWDTGQARSIRGEEYLASRGLSAADLIARGVVRFDPAYGGSPMVAIYGYAGDVVGTATRIIGATGKFRVYVPKGATTIGTMIGRIGELDRQGPDVAIVVEGVTDGLAAVLTWPGCVILAAHCAGQMARVVREAAPTVREIGGYLLIVPDRSDDEARTGPRAAADAVEAAEAAGLVLDRDVHLVDLGDHDDLNDAVRDGWSWTWAA